MGINKAKEIVTEAKIKIMELPYFEEKLDIVSSLIELEWKLKEQKSTKYVYEDEVAEEISSLWEHPWSE